MTEEELERFNRGNEIREILPTLRRELSIIQTKGSLSSKRLEIRIEEKFGDQNRFRTNIDHHQEIDIEVVNKSVCKMYEYLIRELEKEFNEL